MSSRFQIGERVTSGDRQAGSTAPEPVLCYDLVLMERDGDAQERLLVSDYLYADPSWGSGMGRVIDLAGVFDEYNTCETEPEADALAMWLDWASVGKAVLEARGDAAIGETGSRTE